MSANVRQGRVANGGFWTSKQRPYSSETHQLLRQMMEESKLTNLQKKHLFGRMQDGCSLPLECKLSEKESGSHHMKSVIAPRSYSTGRRTRKTMEAMGAYKIDRYRPKPGKCYSENEKAKLADIMAYGKDGDIQPVKEASRKLVIEESDEEVDEFKELQKEIEERKEFLEEMNALGQGNKYRTIIETEISQKIREMEIIDKQRNEDLQRMREEESKKTIPLSRHKATDITEDRSDPEDMNSCSKPHSPVPESCAER